jgi:hypothetical protein
MRTGKDKEEEDGTELSDDRGVSELEEVGGCVWAYDSEHTANVFGGDAS